MLALGAAPAQAVLASTDAIAATLPQAPVTVHDRSETIYGVHPYLRDLPDAEFYLLDTGHFALEDRLAEMAPLIRDFLDRQVASQ